MAEPTPEQRALFQEHFRPRTDGRPDYTLEEHLRILALVAENGHDDEALARQLGVPPAYIRALRETARRPAPAQAHAGAEAKRLRREGQ
jgi:transposase-like protein